MRQDSKDSSAVMQGRITRFTSQKRKLIAHNHVKTHSAYKGKREKPAIDDQGW